MSSSDQYKIIGLCKISDSIKQPCNSVYLKNIRNALNLLEQCSTLAKQGGNSNILINSKLYKFITLPEFCLTACLTAVRPGSAM